MTPARPERFYTDKERLVYLEALLDAGQGDEARKLAYEWIRTEVIGGRRGFEAVIKVFTDWHVNEAMMSAPIPE